MADSTYSLLMWDLNTCKEEELEGCWAAASFLVLPAAMMGFLFTILLGVVSYTHSTPSSANSFPSISDNLSSIILLAVFLITPLPKVIL